MHRAYTSARSCHRIFDSPACFIPVRSTGWRPRALVRALRLSLSLSSTMTTSTTLGLRFAGFAGGIRKVDGERRGQRSDPDRSARAISTTAYKRIANRTEGMNRRQHAPPNNQTIRRRGVKCPSRRFAAENRHRSGPL